MNDWLSGLWAVTRTTLLNALRERVALVVFALMILGSLLIVQFVEGDNTLSGQLSVVMNWSLSLISLLLMALVIYLSSTALDQEFRSKHILMLSVKPIGRFDILLGKWLGLAILSGWMLLAMGSFSLCSYYWVVARAQNAGRGVERRVDTDKVYQELLVSRRSFKPVVDNLEEELTQFQERLVANEIISEDEAKRPEFKMYLATILNLQLLTLEPKARRVFQFQGLPVQDVTDLTVRYRFYGHELGENAKVLRHFWEFRDPDGGVPRAQGDYSSSGKTKEFQVSAKNLTKSGRLQLTLQNLSIKSRGLGAARLVIPVNEGIEILIPAGSFLGNYFRALLLLWIRLLFLAGFGLAASTTLRAQVTAFALITIVVVGFLSPMAQDYLKPKQVGTYEALKAHLREAEQRAQKDSSYATLQAVSKTALPPMLQVLPDFSDTDPVPDLLLGREISWSRLMLQAMTHLLLRLGVVFAVGTILFERREVGLPQS